MNKDSHALLVEEKRQEVVQVLVPVPTEVAYSYAVPEEMSVQPGSIVQVPIGPRIVSGVVWDGEGEDVPAKKLREIEHVFDCPPLTGDMRKFIDWVADYCLAAPGLVARMALRAPAAFDPEPYVEGIQLTPNRPERMTSARKNVIAAASDGLAWTKSGLAHAAGVSVSVVEGLIKQSVFEKVLLPPRPVAAVPDTKYHAPHLETEQQAVAGQLIDQVERQTFSVNLLDGVTGSGKTEVYFEAIAAALDAGKQVLILVPEIALTAAFLDRFQDRFGSKPAEWHSDVSPRMREKVWRQVALGTVRVVVGARSSLFLPFPELGLIVVDEEHDPAFKQEDRIFYNARDMAVVRAHILAAPIILASATPSLETRVNCEIGRYERHVLPNRFGIATLPNLELLDMRKTPPARGKFLSPPLIDAIEAALARDEQSLLFLNRRGYAPLTLCRVCGHRFECQNCSTWLVEHRFRHQLQCHHCGHHERTPDACPSCGTLDHLVACGPGVERIAEEVVERFPDARTIVLSSDMAGGVRRLRLELEAIANGEADIVIGTQLVAKGHNFPKMSCVGVIDADIGLSNGDPRAAERTYQLLSQVTGRAGRSGLASRGLLQTYQPQHPVMQSIVSADAEAFYAREMIEREKAGLPPYGRLAGIVISGPDRSETEIHARGLRQSAPASRDIRILGPAEAALGLLRGRHRFRLLIQGTRRSDIQAYIRQMTADGPKIRGQIRVQVDIDPQSFL